MSGDAHAANVATGHEKPMCRIDQNTVTGSRTSSR